MQKKKKKTKPKRKNLHHISPTRRCVRSEILFARISRLITLKMEPIPAVKFVVPHDMK